MINKRLINMVDEAKKPIAKNVISQLLGLAATIIMIFTIGLFLDGLFNGAIALNQFYLYITIIVFCITAKLAWAILHHYKAIKLRNQLRSF